MIIFPVNGLNIIKKTFDPPTFSHDMNSALASYPVYISEG